MRSDSCLSRLNIPIAVMALWVFASPVQCAESGELKPEEVVWNVLAADLAYSKALYDQSNLRISYVLEEMEFNRGQDIELKARLQRRLEQQEAMRDRVSTERARSLIDARMRYLRTMIEEDMKTLRREKVVYTFLGEEARQDSVDLFRQDFEDVATVDASEYSSSVWRPGKKTLHLDRISGQAQIGRPERSPRERVLQRLATGRSSRPLAQTVVFVAFRDPELMEMFRKIQQSGGSDMERGEALLQAILDRGAETLAPAMKDIEVSRVERDGREMICVTTGPSPEDAMEYAGEIREEGPGIVKYHTYVDPRRGYIVVEESKRVRGELKERKLVGETQIDPVSTQHSARSFVQTTYGHDGRISKQVRYSDIAVEPLDVSANAEDLLKLEFPEGTDVVDTSG